MSTQELAAGDELSQSSVCGGEYSISDLEPSVKVEYTCVNTPDDSEGHDGEVIVAVNGWGENSATLNARKQAYVESAEARGEPLTVVSYDADLYCQSDQDVALLEVVRSLPWDQPVILDAHSRGGVTAVEDGQILFSEGLLKGMVLTESAGYGEVKLSPKAMVATLSAEVGAAVTTLTSQRARDVGSNFLSGIMRHVVCHPFAALREIAEISSADTTAETVALSREMPIMVVNGLRDCLCSGEESTAHLLDEGMPVEDVELLDVTHTSPLINPIYIQETTAL